LEFEWRTSQPAGRPASAFCICQQASMLLGAKYRGSKQTVSEAWHIPFCGTRGLEGGVILRGELTLKRLLLRLYKAVLVDGGMLKCAAGTLRAVRGSQDLRGAALRLLDSGWYIGREPGCRRRRPLVPCTFRRRIHQI
jgi:hypothetical protein